MTSSRQRLWIAIGAILLAAQLIIFVLDDKEPVITIDQIEVY